MANLNRFARVCVTVGDSTSCGGSGGGPTPEPSEWDGNYETLPNLVAGWLPDRGLYKDAEGLQPVGEGDRVSFVKDIVNGVPAATSTFGIPADSTVINGIATYKPEVRDKEVVLVVGFGGFSPVPELAVAEIVAGAFDDKGVNQFFAQTKGVNEDQGTAAFVASITGEWAADLTGIEGTHGAFVQVGGMPEEGVIPILPFSPSPISVYVKDGVSHVVSVNGSSATGEEGSVVAVDQRDMEVRSRLNRNTPITPALLFSEPLPPEIRTQLLNKLKDDFPAWGEPVPADDPLTLTFENQAGFFWNPEALSSVEIDWGDGAGYQTQNVQAGAASMVYGDSDPKTVRVLIEAHEGEYAEICPDCQYATAINDFGTQIVGLGNPEDGWLPLDDLGVFVKATIASWPDELPEQLTRAIGLCLGATFAEAPDWDYSNIVDGTGMFSDCTSLTSFTSDLSSLVDGTGMFSDCTSLTSFTSDLGSLVNGDGMFDYCPNLTSFTSDLSSLVNGDDMFSDCSSLTTFTSDLSSLVNGGYMFYYCSNLTSFTSDLSSLVNGDYMFSDCSSLTTFASDLSSLVNGYRMFGDCSSLESFSIDLSSLVDGRQMFGNCTSLESFSIDLSSLEIGGMMFAQCSSLTSFTSDLSSLTNGYSMFNGCTSLASFTSDLSSLENGDGMFSGCSSLTTVNATMTGALVSATYMFSNCPAFSQDISDWCVPLIQSKPDYFDTGAGFENQPELQPQWGEPC